MGRNERFRCPICGHIVMDRNLTKNFDIETFKLRGLGRARGFANDPILNPGLVLRVKNKIKALYKRFFVENRVQIQIPIIPRVFLREAPELSLSPPISIKTEVKMVG